MFTGATLGFQQIVTRELNFALGQKGGKMHVERKGPYQTIVQCAAKTLVLLYGFDEKRAWLVPTSAVILHAAKAKHFRQPFIYNGRLVEFPSLNTTSNKHGAAEQTLIEGTTIKLSSQDGLGSGGYYMKDLVRDIWSLLENLLDKNVNMEMSSDLEIQTTMRAHTPWLGIYGLSRRHLTLPAKADVHFKSSGGWMDLAQDTDAIALFVSGFEDIIRSTKEATAELCHKWKQVPKDQDYLAVSVPMLYQLFERAGSRLTRKHLTSTYLRWHCGYKL